MHLTKKQIAALDELYYNNGDELAVQQKLNISPRQWRRWLNNYYFNVEMRYRLDLLHSQADIICAKFRPMAIAMLISLCQSENEEIRRKACVELLKLKPCRDGTELPSPPAKKDLEIDKETASKLMAVLAESKCCREKNGRAGSQ